MCVESKATLLYGLERLWASARKLARAFKCWGGEWPLHFAAYSQGVHISATCIWTNQSRVMKGWAWGEFLAEFRFVLDVRVSGGSKLTEYGGSPREEIPVHARPGVLRASPKPGRHASVRDLTANAGNLRDTNRRGPRVPSLSSRGA